MTSLKLFLFFLHCLTCRTLHNALSDFEFQSSQFVPYLEPSFSLIFTLLKEAKECDTKVRNRTMTRDLYYED